MTEAIDVKARVLNEQGRPSKCILPPRNTRVIHTDESLEGTLLSNHDWALRSVFAVAAAPGTVLLYNGGFETQYISHGDLIAKVIPS